MSILEAVALLAAAFCAGSINAVAGGGSLISFPALIAFGYPAKTANVTNTVALWPGYVSGSLAYRPELRRQKERVMRLLVPTVSGALLGSVILIATSEDAFESIMTILRKDQPNMVAIADSLLGHMYMIQGNRPEALRRLRSCGREGFAAIPKNDTWPLQMGLAAELAVYLGETESAEEIYSLLAPMAEFNLCDPQGGISFGPVAHFLGVLAAALDRPKQAIQHFESSIELSTKMRARVHQTRSEFELARVLEQSGELNLAQNLRESALASARELGMLLQP